MMNFSDRLHCAALCTAGLFSCVFLEIRAFGAHCLQVSPVPPVNQWRNMLYDLSIRNPYFPCFDLFIHRVNDFPFLVFAHRLSIFLYGLGMSLLCCFRDPFLLLLLQRRPLFICLQKFSVYHLMVFGHTRFNSSLPAFRVLVTMRCYYSTIGRIVCTPPHEKRRSENCIQAPMPLFWAPFCPCFCMFFCVSVTNLLSRTDFSLQFQGWKGTDFAAANGATPCKIRTSPFFPIIP